MKIHTTATTGERRSQNFFDHMKLLMVSSAQSGYLIGWNGHPISINLKPRFIIDAFDVYAQFKKVCFTEEIKNQFKSSSEVCQTSQYPYVTLPLHHLKALILILSTNQITGSSNRWILRNNFNFRVYFGNVDWLQVVMRIWRLLWKLSFHYKTCGCGYIVDVGDGCWREHLLRRHDSSHLVTNAYLFKRASVTNIPQTSLTRSQVKVVTG